MQRITGAAGSSTPQDPLVPQMGADNQEHRMFIPKTPSTDEAARLLCGVGLDLTRHVAHRLPGIAEVFPRRVVFCVNGTHVVGPLDTYTSLAWWPRGEYLDQLTIALRHAAHVA